MNNENELHDVTFKIRYPNKKEKTAYAVKSILIDELTILAENIIIAAIICSFFLNEWSISQKMLCIYGISVYDVFCFTNICAFKGSVREILFKKILCK